MLLVHREAVACDCHHICHKRHVLLYGLIYCERCCYVLNYGSNVDRKAHRLHLTAHHSVDELLLTTLRILLLEGHHRDAVISLCSLLKLSHCSCHGSDSLRLVLLDTDHCLASAENLLHDRSTYYDLLASLDHDAVVRCEVRLTLGSVENEALSNLSRRRAKLHMRREGSTSESYDTIEFDLLENGLVILRNLCHESIGKVDAFSPLVALDVDLDMSHVVACLILARSYRLQST